MKYIKNSNIKILGFEDAFFVKTKIEKSITLPKFSPTPKTSQNPPESHNNLSPFKEINESFIERVKNQKIKPSKDELNKWLNQKQIQFKRIINRQNQNCNLQIKVPSSDEKIYLRTPQEIDQMKNQKLKNIKEFDENLSNKKLMSKQSISKRVSCPKKNDQKLDHSSESCRKINQKITVFPVLLKLKQANRKMGHSELFLNENQNLRKQDVSICVKPSQLKKSNTQRLFVNQNKSQRSLILKSTQQEDQKGQNLNKTSYSFILQRKSISRSFQTFKSPLYQLKSEAPEPIKKYSHRQVSNKKQKDLLNKYEHLESRLENLLRQTRTQKERKD